MRYGHLINIISTRFLEYLIISRYRYSLSLSLSIPSCNSHHITCWYVVKTYIVDYGYVERRPEASFTLFFAERSPSDPTHPTLINIYYTTRGIMTKCNHPEKGYNELWRVSAYDSLASLAMLFEDPRTHTGKGYRNVKSKPMTRGCVQCGYSMVRSEFTEEMWMAGVHKCICRQCCASSQGGENGIATGVGGEGGDTTITANGGGNKKTRNKKTSNGNNSSNNNHNIVPTLVLSEDALREHNRSTSTSTSGGDGGGGKRGGVERRQFNCPICPTEGRGKNVFFKNVPVDKPIVKCPKCKKAKSGKCDRLYPIPKGEEKGYGK